MTTFDWSIPLDVIFISDTTHIIYCRVRDMLKSDDIEALKREFIITKEEEEERLKEILKKIVKFVKVTEEGAIVFEIKDLAGIDRIGLALAARYVAGKLVENIRQEVSLDELSQITGLKEKVASARVKDLAKEGLVERLGRGLYRARGLFAVEKIIEKVTEKYTLGDLESEE